MAGSAALVAGKMPPSQNGQFCQTFICPPNSPSLNQAQRYPPDRQGYIQIPLEGQMTTYFTNIYLGMYLPRGEGGINLPNVRFYNLSCLFRIALDWVSQSSHYPNHELESQMSDPFSLKALLHTKWKAMPPHLQHNILLRDTVIAWREVRKQLWLPLSISKFSPIVGNTDFTPGLDSSVFSSWKKKGLIYFSDLCDLNSGLPHSPQAVIDRIDLPRANFFSLLQCSHFIRSSTTDAHKRFKTHWLTPYWPGGNTAYRKSINHFFVSPPCIIHHHQTPTGQNTFQQSMTLYLKYFKVTRER